MRYQYAGGNSPVQGGSDQYQTEQQQTRFHNKTKSMGAARQAFTSKNSTEIGSGTFQATKEWQASQKVPSRRRYLSETTNSAEGGVGQDRSRIYSPQSPPEEVQLKQAINRKGVKTQNQPRSIRQRRIANIVDHFAFSQPQISNHSNNYYLYERTADTVAEGNYAPQQQIVIEEEEEVIDQDMILYEGRQISDNNQHHQVHSSHLGKRQNLGQGQQQQGRCQTSHIGARKKIVNQFPPSPTNGEQAILQFKDITSSVGAADDIRNSFGDLQHPIIVESYGSRPTSKEIYGARPMAAQQRQKRR